MSRGVGGVEVLWDGVRKPDKKIQAGKQGRSVTKSTLGAGFKTGEGGRGAENNAWGVRCGKRERAAKLRTERKRISLKQKNKKKKKKKRKASTRPMIWGNMSHLRVPTRKWGD